MENLKCTLCNSDRQHHFTQRILNKYEVDYFYCDYCGLVQTEQPYWLDEAYGNAIANADTGLVGRNIGISKKLSGVLFFLFKKDGKYLDIAGGHGMLTRLMRDIGFDFYWSDPYCQNTLSKGFELFTTKPPFTAITAFEVLEHVYDPLEFIREALTCSETSTIIFSTELFSTVPPAASDWHYYLPETGQHISFYQLKTLKFIASELSLNLYSYENFHILTKEEIKPQLLWSLLTSRPATFTGLYVKLTMKSKSKTLVDYHKMLKVLSD